MDILDKLLAAGAIVVLIMQSVAWYGCSSRGGEFVRAPFEIGYHCTK